MLRQTVEPAKGLHPPSSLRKYIVNRLEKRTRQLIGEGGEYHQVQLEGCLYSVDEYHCNPLGYGFDIGGRKNSANKSAFVSVNKWPSCQ